MESIGTLSWKQYYAREREHRREEIGNAISSSWEDPDPRVCAVLERGGVLSVPHTFLDSSMAPLVRTVRAIARTGREKVLAVGLVHGGTDDASDEFCLDGLEAVLRLAHEVVDMPKLPVEKVFIGRDARTDPNDIGKMVRDAQGIGRALRGRMDGSTALISTGDLVHYGYGYDTADVRKDPEDLIRGMIISSLDVLWRERDLVAFMELSRKVKSDHHNVAVAVSEVLGKRTDYEIFSSELSDYSDVLGAMRPTVVASVFYGAYPR